MTLSYRKVNSESVKQNNLFAKHINTILDEEQIKLEICAHFEFHATKAAEGEIYNT